MSIVRVGDCQFARVKCCIRDDRGESTLCGQAARGARTRLPTFSRGPARRRPDSKGRHSNARLRGSEHVVFHAFSVDSDSDETPFGPRELLDQQRSRVGHALACRIEFIPCPKMGRQAQPCPTERERRHERTRRPFQPRNRLAPSEGCAERQSPRWSFAVVRSRPAYRIGIADDRDCDRLTGLHGIAAAATN